MTSRQSKDKPFVHSSRTQRLLRQRQLRGGIIYNISARNRSLEASIHDLSASPHSDHDPDEGLEPPVREQRLLVVANRLPVSAVRKGSESWSLEISGGGLVSALVGVKEIDARWIGWPGIEVPDEVGQRSLTRALAEKMCIPVFLSEEIVHQYYNGYCNNILWPLFHYLGLPHEDRLETTKTFQSQFEAYKRANKMFADVVYNHYKEGDVVWCHDYHLMFLPKYLKEYNSEIKVGWFLHTPFPSSEIHRTLPSRSELLQAVLTADLVGFHTYDYARHFVSACTRILGIEGTPEGVEDQGRLTRVAVFPVGIDSERFIRALENPQVQNCIKKLKEKISGKKVMLGVDRLDMIKGIPQKILAFEKFLEENPDWRNSVVLLQIAVPTRTDVPEYKKLKSRVHEIVGRVNGRFGTLTEVPVHHLDCSVDFHDLCAIYSVTDVALVTSLRDGMNLVSYEFVACQDSKKGVLILSEFAGAAQSLGAGAILVNPWNTTEVAAAIGQALNMPAEEREKRHLHNFKHVTSHTAQQWAEFFISELNDTVIEAQHRIRKVPPQLVVNDAVRMFLRSVNRLLILGFNAALTEVPGRGRGDRIKEMELKLHPELKEPLTLLCGDPNTTIMILSGSGRDVLDNNFGGYDMWLAAENGMFLRSTKGRWMTTMPEHLNLEWFDCVKQVFEYFTERTPRSLFEQRETSLQWNYRYADVEFGLLQSKDMLQHLVTGPISNTSVDVVQGSRSVEARTLGVTKGAAIDRILGEVHCTKSFRTPIDYVLCLGHFLAKDEDIYTFFEPEAPPESGTTSKDTTPKKASGRSSIKSQGKSHPPGLSTDEKSPRRTSRGSEQASRSLVDLKDEKFFSCAVGRTCTRARYLLNSSDDVVTFIKELAAALAPNSSD